MVVFVKTAERSGCQAHAVGTHMNSSHLSRIGAHNVAFAQANLRRYIHRITQSELGSTIIGSGNYITGDSNHHSIAQIQFVGGRKTKICSPHNISNVLPLAKEYIVVLSNIITSITPAMSLNQPWTGE